LEIRRKAIENLFLLLNNPKKESTHSLPPLESRINYSRNPRA